ncbi:sugar porter family MFS transporter [Cutibacterium equinum]|uniref:Sugar porter family MFS transporter n=2 Tax=Cutibacterium equinum TaxID=3016342 RepID=A0ABY7R1U4_9ACTN|nr:sugar porter family MFS transporter [Cutibacterium equinum]WCC80727.1 sugar porter family MFS transporter [Cutibacterium equinum]
MASSDPVQRDVKASRYETDGAANSNQMRRAIFIAVTAAALGITYGYDISNTAAALQFVKRDFGIYSSINTASVLGQIGGAIIGGPMANAIGRKKSMIIIAAGYTVFAVLTAVSPSAGSFLAMRVLLGITIGLSITVVPVFIAESAPASRRGGLATAYQVTCVIGIILGYLVGYLLLPTDTWRWILGVAAIPALVVLVMLFRTEETPSWYMLKGREQEARRAMERIEAAELVEPSLDEIRNSLSSQPDGSVWQRLREMFHGGMARTTLFAIVLGFSIQITGINATIYYAPGIYSRMGFTDTATTYLVPSLVQFLSLISVVISMLVIDKVGRRFVLITGISTMIFATILLIVTYLMSGFEGTAAGVMGLIGMSLFTMGYTFGFGSIVWVYAGEIFPARYRSIGASLVLTADLVANAITAQLGAVMLDGIGLAGTFGVYGGLLVIALLFLLRYAPETSGRSLEEIQDYWNNGARWPETESSSMA